MKTLIILFTILIAGCANLSEMTDEERSTYLDRQEDRLYDRQEALVEEKMDYYERTAACRNTGGFMVVRKRSASRIKSRVTEDKYEYRNALCAKW